MTNLDSSNYIGNELTLFSMAKNWKTYHGDFIKPYLKGKVLEVGAGIGSTTESLCDGSQELWTCVEPDFRLAEHIKKKIIKKKLLSCCNVISGTIEALPKTDVYNTILYIDVIEHISNDSLEIFQASQYLCRGGKLIVLVPSHQFLFSKFDKAIGHYRRYNKKMLRRLVPAFYIERNLFYLDSIGFLASIANKYLLKQSYPSENQIKFWDKFLVKLSTHVDSRISFLFGKSLLGIWEKK